MSIDKTNRENAQVVEPRRCGENHTHSMSYLIKPVEHAKCVFLTCEGEMTLIETAAARQQVAELLAAKQWNQIIVDATAMRSVLKARELCDLGRVAPSSARIGLVVRPDQVKHAMLIEKVARHGGTFPRFFIDVEKAEAWAQGNPEIKPKLT